MIIQFYLKFIIIVTLLVLLPFSYQPVSTQDSHQWESFYLFPNRMVKQIIFESNQAQRINLELNVSSLYHVISQYNYINYDLHININLIDDYSSETVYEEHFIFPFLVKKISLELFQSPDPSTFANQTVSGFYKISDNNWESFKLEIPISSVSIYHNSNKFIYYNISLTIHIFDIDNGSFVIGLSDHSEVLKAPGIYSFIFTTSFIYFSYSSSQNSSKVSGEYLLFSYGPISTFSYSNSYYQNEGLLIFIPFAFFILGGVIISFFLGIFVSYRKRK